MVNARIAGIVIGVIGSDCFITDKSMSSKVLSIAENVGKFIAQRGATLLTDGSGGLIEAVSRGANQAGGIVVGLLSSNSKSDANEYVTIPLVTALENINNALVVRASEVVIMISGGNETLQEAIVAYGRKPLIVIEGTGGWSDRIRGSLYDGFYFDERKSGDIVYVSTADEAITKAFELVKTFQPKEGLTISKNPKDLPDPS